MELKTISNLGRLRDIIVVLLKYGFDDLVHRLDVASIGPFKRLPGAAHGLDTYERIRMALEDLGPTFVKFGQIMSLRPDILPQALIRELSKLQDDVAPVPFEEIRRVIEESLGRPLEEVFSIFDRAPIAAASLSQVHKAVLKNEGAIVSVKVQRPGVREKMKSDLNILASIAERLHEHSKDLKIYDLPNLVRISRKTMMKETDFCREAQHIQIARSHLGEGADIYIPAVFDAYSNEKLLVVEHIQGTKVKDLDLNRIGIEAEVLAKKGLRAAIKQILKDGFFHADPHPGNLIITEGMRLCLLDWGMVGRLVERDRYELIDLIKAVIDKDSRSLTDVLLIITDAHGMIDRRGLERDLMDILDAYHAQPIKDWNIGQLLLDITALLRNYRLKLSPDLVIMIKALVTAEGTARQLYPELNIISESETYVKQLAGERFKPDALWRNLRTAVSQVMAVQRQLPMRFIQIVDKIDRGELTIRTEHRNLEGLKFTLENASNRLTVGIIIASMIIGSSMIITTGIGPLWFGYPAFGVLGYLVSAVFGVWVIYNIFRSKRY